jgi:hypothetical protein
VKHETAWHEQVLWRRGYLGNLHAQWLGDEEPHLAACGADLPSDSPPVPYSSRETVCRNCKTLALSLVGETEPRPQPPAGVVEYVASRRGSARIDDVMVALGLSRDRAAQALRRAWKAGKLERLEPGVYAAREGWLSSASWPSQPRSPRRRQPR